MALQAFKAYMIFVAEIFRSVFRWMPFVGPKKYLQYTRLDNKVVIITGGNTGIGKATAKKLVSRGAKVIIGCRDAKRGQQAADEINSQVINNGKVYFKQLDLASFESIRKFADEINGEEDAIDILINNAGVAMLKNDVRTNQGFEMNFGVNHLGHFLLTLLLLDKLKKSKSIARIINVTGAIYIISEIQFDDINFDKNFNPIKTYAHSKLCNVLFTHELAKRLGDTNIRVYAVHPGVIKTELVRHGGVLKYLINILFAPMFLSPESGCQTTLHCALDEQAANESGLYYANCTKYVNDSWCMDNNFTIKAYDDLTAEKLWDLSCDLVKLEDKYKLPLLRI